MPVILIVDFSGYIFDEGFLTTGFLMTYNGSRNMRPETDFFSVKVIIIIESDNIN
jgi:hypothetical protein